MYHYSQLQMAITRLTTRNVIYTPSSNVCAYFWCLFHMNMNQRQTARYNVNAVYAIVHPHLCKSTPLIQSEIVLKSLMVVD